MSLVPYSLYRLKRTPFHERVAALCLPQNWRRWAGCITVGSYDLGIDREYWAIRDAAALIDVSPLMKYLIEGPDAERLLDRLTPRNIRKMAVGQVFYTGWCDDDGKVLDDQNRQLIDSRLPPRGRAQRALRRLERTLQQLETQLA